jgi:hypothetical protein
MAVTRNRREDVRQGTLTANNRNKDLTTRNRIADMRIDLKDVVVGQFSFMLSRMLVEAQKVFGEAMAVEFRAAADQFSRNAGKRSELIALHQRVGDLAQQAVLESYKDLITGREGPASQSNYRSDAGGNMRRYAAGVLGEALADPQFFAADYNGIRFANTNLLNQAAKQWRRLAFGAAPAGEGARSTFAVSFGGLTAGAIGLDEKASGPVILPAGSFLDQNGDAVAFSESRRGLDVFEPAAFIGADVQRFSAGGIGTRKLTAGIHGRDFFSAGLAVIAVELPKGYGDYGRSLLDGVFKSGTVSAEIKG